MSKKNQNLLPGEKKTVSEIIDYCKNELGISFNLMDEDNAKNFLSKHNYFFRIKQYTDICQEKLNLENILVLILVI